MDSFEFNKISAAVISGVLLIMVLSIGAEVIYPEPKSEKLAYSVEIQEESGAGNAAAAQGPSLAELLVAANVDKGATEFKKCVACHSVGKGEANKLGPNLYDIVGRDLAAVDSFGSYSGAIKEKGGAWTYEMLDAWLKNPKSVISGTSMAFGGIRKADKRANLIAYLRTFSDAPKALPEVMAKEEAGE